MNNTAELVRLKEEQLRLSQSKREHENKLSAILALIRKEGRMTREKYQQCCDAQIRHKQGIKRVDEMISSVKIKIFELSRLENQNKQSMERRLVDLERENAALRDDYVVLATKFSTSEHNVSCLAEALHIADQTLSNCLNNSPLNPFERGDAIKAARKKICAAIDIARKEAQP